jgi:hypothetical protein
MATKYTKDVLFDVVIQNNKDMTEAMNRISSAVEAINHSNELHSTIITEHTETIKSMVKVNTAFLSIFKWLIVSLVLAIIVLAGAEKVLKFLPLF